MARLLQPASGNRIEFALPEYSTQDELAEKLKTTSRTIYEMRRRGVLPFVKFGRAVLFDPAAVAAALEKLTVSGRN